MDTVEMLERAVAPSTPELYALAPPSFFYKYLSMKQGLGESRQGGQTGQRLPGGANEQPPSLVTNPPLTRVRGLSRPPELNHLLQPHAAPVLPALSLHRPPLKGPSLAVTPRPCSRWPGVAEAEVVPCGRGLVLPDDPRGAYGPGQLHHELHRGACGPR